MNVFVVREVDYDGHKIGRCWRTAICANKDAVAKFTELFTEPARYRDGERKFKPHVHVERNGKHIHGHLGPVPTFVYVDEQRVHGLDRNEEVPDE